MPPRDPETGEVVGNLYQQVGLRPGVEARYQLIPLAIMAKVAVDLGEPEPEEL